MATCKNCAHEYEGKYCPQCGQRAKVKRITTKAVFEEIRERLLHLDSGFLFTFLQLVRRPGAAIREFIEGKRAPYTKPIKFMLWATAINLLVMHLTGLDEEIIHAVTEQQAQQPVSAEAKAFQEGLTRYINEHPALVLLLMIPNISLCSWLLFRKEQYNYAEHVVLNAYLMGAVGLFGVVTNPLLKLIHTDQANFFLKYLFNLAFWFGYVGWGYVGFFQPQRRKWLYWLKAVLSTATGYVVMILVITIVAAIFVIAFWPWLKPYFT